MRRYLFFAVIFLFCKVNIVYALGVETHMAINDYISKNNMQSFSFDTYLKGNLGFASGRDEVFNAKAAWIWLRDGGYYEDIPAWYEKYLRSVNHFHNPLKFVDQAGFTGVWGSGVLSGMSAVLWSQRDERTQTYGYYSWDDVRDYYLIALTSPDKTVRDTNFADTFRGLGQLMHLVQDMSVPEHARDDGHYVDAYEEWVKDKGAARLNNALSNPIFLDPSALAQPSHFTASDFANFGSYTVPIVPIANLFDTRQYYHTKDPNITVANTVGLAEYTNANYVSADTIFTVFTYPSPTSSVTKTTHEYHNPLNPTESVQRPYWLKNADGDTGYLLAGVDYIHFWGINNNMPSLQAGVFVPPMDENVYAGYATRLLPRAVGYSSEILNYFFRGSLTISAPDRCLYGIIDGAVIPQQFTKIRAKVKNSSFIKDQQGNIISLEEIRNGTIQAVARYKKRTDYQPDLSTDPPDETSIDPSFSYSVSEPISLTPGDIDALNGANGAAPKEFTFNFGDGAIGPPIPAGITDLYLHVVFRGTLGNEADNAVAVGMKDIGEPTHINNWNTSDQIYSSGQVIPAADYQKVFLNEKIAICPNWPVTAYDVQYTPLGPGEFGRIITLSDPGQEIWYQVVDEIASGDPSAQVGSQWYSYTSVINQDNNFDTKIYTFRGKAFHEGYGYFYYYDANEWLVAWPPGVNADAIRATVFDFQW